MAQASSEVAIGLIEEQLTSDDANEQLQGLKQLKNALIGHTDKKDSLLADYIMYPLLDILKQSLSSSCRIESAVIIGSYAHGTDATVQRLISYPVVDTLIGILEQGQQSLQQQQQQDLSVPKLIIACLRVMITLLESRGFLAVVGKESSIIMILKEYLASADTPVDILSQCYKLIPLLRSNTGSLGAIAPDLQSAITSTSSSQEKSMDLSVLTNYMAVRIAQLTRQYKRIPSKTLPLDSALAALSKCISPHQARELLQTGPQPISGDEFVDALIEFTRAEDGSVRLTAVELLAKLQKYAVSPKQANLMIRPLLPTIVPLMSQLGSDPRIALSLSYVCRDSEQCAALAVEVGIVKQIMTVMKKVDVVNRKKSELVENNLLALAAIGIHKDEFRKEIVEQGVIPYIIEIISLQPNDPETMAVIQPVKAAACHVLRALSRSVRILRTTLASNDVVDAIVKLLHETSESSVAGNTNGTTIDDEHEHQWIGDDTPIKPNAALEVRTAVMAAICNLVLEFSPVQKYILNKNVLSEIVQSASSSYGPLRLNAVWALKHLIYQAGPQSKDAVIRKLKLKRLFELWDDPIFSVQEQALDFVRNFFCDYNDGIEYVLSFEPNFFNRLNSKLDSESVYPPLIVPVLYILVHMTAVSDKYRDLVASQEGLLRRIVPFLSHEIQEIRTAAVWLVINLTWNDDQTSELRTDGCKARAETLLKLGVREKLEECRLDCCLDVKERIKTALFQIEVLVGDSTSHPRRGL